jgi:hypothetical protein
MRVILRGLPPHECIIVLEGHIERPLILSICHQLSPEVLDDLCAPEFLDEFAPIGFNLSCELTLEKLFGMTVCSRVWGIRTVVRSRRTWI